MPLAPAHKHKARETYTIGSADTRILSVIVRYHCMTALQVTTLLYARASLTRVQTKLKQLTDAGYLIRDRIPTRPTEGSAPLYYALSRTGLAHLASLGMAVPPPNRAYQVHE